MAVYKEAHPHDGDTFASPRMGADGPGTARHRASATGEGDREEDW